MQAPAKGVRATAPTFNRSIWGTRPGLKDVQGGRYDGRVFIEVWENDVQLAVCGGDSTLIARAYAALQGRYSPLHEQESPWTNEPASGEIAGQRFLGRVVVELWNTQAVVGISGSDSRVLERAVQRLAAL